MIPIVEFKTKTRLLGEANELKRRTDYQSALALYLHYIERFGESADLFALVANCYFSLAVTNAVETGQNFERAVLYAERAVSLEPDTHRFHLELAQYYSLGVLEYEKALQEYRNAITLAPNNVDALVGAASLYGVPEQVVELDEAIGWLKQATLLEPDEPNFHYQLGRLYKEAGRFIDAAQEWLEALLSSKPLNTDLSRIMRDIADISID